MNEEKNIELLEIKKCKFRYTKSEIASEWNKYDRYVENNPYCDEDNYKGIREEKTKKKSRDQTFYRNDDYYISGLKGLLKNPTIENSLRVWKTLLNSSEYVLRAVYIPNQTFEKENPHLLGFPSRIAHLMKKYAWIPNQKEVFYKPSEITLEDVHSDFTYDNPYGWKYDIGLFDKETSKYVKEQQKEGDFKEELKKKEEAAKLLGFTMEEVVIFTKYKEMLEKRIGSFVDIFETQNN